MLLHFLLGIGVLLFIINGICHVSTFKVRGFPLGDFVVIFLFSYAFFVCLGPLMRLGRDFSGILRVFAINTKKIADHKTLLMGNTRQRLQKGMERQIIQQMDGAISETLKSYGGETPFINTMRKRQDECKECY
ncbi:MAG: hypothetical protein KAR05_00225 [Candidatus Omnitrophica bacterium]|nr:hypothetical protein [Candidatus Omnitrophota bacterium]